MARRGEARQGDPKDGSADAPFGDHLNGAFVFLRAHEVDGHDAPVFGDRGVRREARWVVDHHGDAPPLGTLPGKARPAWTRGAGCV